jgi:hypothetical protein
MTLKTIDEKGRLTLGKEYAGKHVVIEKDDAALRVTFKRVVPEREGWLWDNPDAIGRVGEGLEQALRGNLSDGPDLNEAFALADSIPDDEE